MSESLTMAPGVSNGQRARWRDGRPLVNDLTPWLIHKNQNWFASCASAGGNKQGLSVRALPKFTAAQCTLRTIPTRVLLLLRDSGSCPHIVRIILVFA